MKRNAIEKRLHQEKLTLEYLSKTVLSGVRPYELEILQRLFKSDRISIAELTNELKMPIYILLMKLPLKMRFRY